MKPQQQLTVLWRKVNKWRNRQIGKSFFYGKKCQKFSYFCFCSLPICFSYTIFTTLIEIVFVPQPISALLHMTRPHCTGFDTERQRSLVCCGCPQLTVELEHHLRIYWHGFCITSGCVRSETVCPDTVLTWTQMRRACTERSITLSDSILAWVCVSF